MHLIRRAAFRAAASSPSTSFLAKSRSINTSSPFALRLKAQSPIASSVFSRRFNSDEATKEREQHNGEPAETNGEKGAVQSAIDSVTETASEYAHQASEAVSNASDSFGAATGAYPPREDRNSQRSSYNQDRGGYGGSSYEGNRPSRDSRNSFGSPRGGDRVMVPSPVVYVGNLFFDVTAEDLQREFAAFGPIKSATVATDPRGMSKGFGYIEYNSIPEATAAIEAKHQTVLEGRRLIVNYMNKSTSNRPASPPSKTLFIGNLAFEMSDADLNKLFRDVKNVVDVRVAIDRRTGQPRGFAHADFTDIESATKGKEYLDQKEVYGRALRVDFSAGSKNSARATEGGSEGSRF